MKQNDLIEPRDYVAHCEPPRIKTSELSHLRQFV